MTHGRKLIHRRRCDVDVAAARQGNVADAAAEENKPCYIFAGGSFLRDLSSWISRRCVFKMSHQRIVHCESVSMLGAFASGHQRCCHCDAKSQAGENETIVREALEQ